MDLAHVLRKPKRLRTLTTLDAGESIRLEEMPVAGLA